MGKLLVPAVLLLIVLVAFFLFTSDRRQRLEQRIARVTKRKDTERKADALSLRKAKDSGLPKVLQTVSAIFPLRAKLERAGLDIAPDMYVAANGVATLFCGVVMVLLQKPPILAGLVAVTLGILLPYAVVGYLGNKRIKKFLTLFPDAIDFIVRGLRSGLPVTESMNMVGIEMPDPVGGIFASIGESVRLGVSVEKALTDTARKLKSTEFNFFVTSIILQRETGGNLSEILNNLSDVLRKRFMMRMKIKAMASEAKASASIVGSLPFFVVGAIWFVSPGYLDPLINDPRGHKAAIGAMISLLTGIGMMVKMAQFEI